MTYIEEILGDIAVVKVTHPEATLKYAMDFRNHLMGLILSGRNKIIVDLTETTFMDSTFLGVLVFSLKRSVANGGGISLLRNKHESPLSTMFEITNMIKVFRIYEEHEDAVASFELVQ